MRPKNGVRKPAQKSVALTVASPVPVLDDGDAGDFYALLLVLPGADHARRVVEVNSSRGIEHRTVSGRNLAPPTTCYTSFDPRAPHLILRQAYCVLLCVVAQDFRQTAH